MPLFALSAPDAGPTELAAALRRWVGAWRASPLAPQPLALAVVVRLPGASFDRQRAALAALAEARQRLSATSLVRIVWRVDADGLAAWRSGGVPPAMIDGLHLSGEACAALSDGRPPAVPFGLPAHDEAELAERLRLQPDWVLLSPVRATPSKPGRPPLTPAVLERLRALAGPRAVALGGVDAASLATLWLAGMRRFAVLRAMDQQPEEVAAALARGLSPTAR